jgi:hypothetical protein
MQFFPVATLAREMVYFRLDAPQAHQFTGRLLNGLVEMGHQIYLATKNLDFVVMAMAIATVLGAVVVLTTPNTLSGLIPTQTPKIAVVSALS